MNIRFVCCVMMTIALTGCASRSTKLSSFQTKILQTSGEMRLVVERERPSPTSRIVCAEPSPDIAKALATLAKLSAGYHGANVGGGVSTAQSVSIMAGRTAGVVGLRDGLFRACEAYANGVISSRSYALILSNYGDILVTLMLGEDAAGVSQPGAVATSATTTDFTLQLPSDSSGGSASVSTGVSDPAAKGTTTPAPSTAPSVGATGEASPAADSPRLAASATDFADDATSSPSVKQQTMASNAAEKAAKAAADKAAAKETAADKAAADKASLAAKTGGATALASSASSNSPPDATAAVPKDLSAPAAVATIAKLFLVDSAEARGRGALLTLCSSGRTTAQGLLWEGEIESPQLNTICEAYATELDDMMKAQNKLALRKITAETVTAEVALKDAELHREMDDLDLAAKKRKVGLK